MADGETISINRFFDPAFATATLSAATTGSGFTSVAFLDKGLSDFGAFSSSDLLDDAGASRRLTAPGFHILEFIVAFTSTKSSDCVIDCELVGKDKAQQSKSVTVSGKRGDIARVSFHAPII
jgi:hypothetical protein